MRLLEYYKITVINVNMSIDILLHINVQFIEPDIRYDSSDVIYLLS